MRRKKRKGGVRSSKLSYEFIAPTMQVLLHDAERKARRDYPALLAIRKCGPRVYALPTDDLINRYWRGWKRRYWSTENVDYVEHHADCRRAGNVSGVTVMVEKDGDSRIVVLLRKDLNREAELQAGVLLATLAHELGHVEDIVRGVNIVAEGSVDMTAAEEFAHHYACQYIVQLASQAQKYGGYIPADQRAAWPSVFAELLQPVMAFYLNEMLPGLQRLDVPSISEAARRVMESPEHDDYRRFAGKYLDE